MTEESSGIADFQQLLEEEERQRVATSKAKKEARLANRRIKRKLDKAMSTGTGKTPQEALVAMMQENNAKDEEETQLLAATKKASQEAKQKAQDKLLSQQDKLLVRQDALDTKRDADDANLADRIAANKKRRDDDLKILAAALIQLETGVPVPDPTGTPIGLQALTPATRTGRRAGLGPQWSASALTGHNPMSPLDEKVAATPKAVAKTPKTLSAELTGRLEVLSPSFDTPDWVPGMSLVLYTATLSDIKKGYVADKPTKVTEGLLDVHGSRQVQDCTVVLTSGTLHCFPAANKPGMLSFLMGSSSKAAKGVGIDIDNVDRIFAGDEVLVAFVGQSAHWYRYKGSCTFEKQAEIALPHVVDLAIKDGQVAFLEERTDNTNTRRGKSFQVRRRTLESILAAQKDDKEEDDKEAAAGTVNIYDSNNRISGKVFLGAKGTVVCLEDAKKNLKLFQVPDDEGRIKSRSRWGFNNSDIVQAVATDGCIVVCHKENGLKYTVSKQWYDIGLPGEEQRFKLAGGGNTILMSTGTKVGYITVHGGESDGKLNMKVLGPEKWWDFGALGATKIVNMGASHDAIHVLVAVQADECFGDSDDEEKEAADMEEEDEKLGPASLFQD